MRRIIPTLFVLVGPCFALGDDQPLKTPDWLGPLPHEHDNQATADAIHAHNSYDANASFGAVVGHYESELHNASVVGVTFSEGADGKGGALIRASQKSLSCSVQIRSDSATQTHVDVDCVLPEPERSSLSSSAPAKFPTGVPAVTEPHRPGKWQVSESKSPFDDSHTVVMSLAAENRITGWLATSLPQLLLRCKEGQTEVFIATGMPASVEFGEYHTVRLRYDTEAPTSTVMNQSTDNKSLFFVDPMPSILRMWKAQTLVVGFTPFNASPVTVRFELSGLSTAIQPLRKACGW